VVIVGAGFGGLAAARALRGAAVDVVLVDKRNHHLFQPLLYQVASSLLDPSEIAYPVRAALRRGGNVDVRLATVEGIDLERRTVRTDRGDLGYDHLIVAAGAVTNWYATPGAEQRGFGLKSVAEAIALRNHVLGSVERAAWTEDAAERRRLLTIVLVGGGATGVELAGAFSELFRLVLRRDFPRLDLAGEVRIVLVESTDHLLTAFRPRLRARALSAVRAKGVEVRLDTTVEEVRDEGVVVGGGELLPAATVVWTAGVHGAPLGEKLGVPLERGGRVAVGPTLQLPAHPEVSVIGDLAAARQEGTVLPQLAPVAIQQGRYVANAVVAGLRGDSVAPFHYIDKGTMATIGRNSAVAQIGPLSFSGFLGWAAWLGVHLVLLVGFRSKLAAMLNWGFDYVFWDRPVRLIATASRTEE
jgi:NADH:ubiquinone reductase (H+-translocating)